MSTDEPQSDGRDPTSPSIDSAEPRDDGETAIMSARTWTIAARFGNPAEYGIPTIPSLAVSRTAEGGIELSADAETEPFISAESPIDVHP